MKTLLKVLGALVLLVLLVAGGTFLWAKSAVASKLSRTPEVHHVSFPIPFPLGEAEIEALKQERAAKLAQAAPAAAPVAAEAGEAAPAAEPAAEGEAAQAPDAPVAPPAPPPVDPLEGVDLDAIASERAAARGKHLVEARYACIECHGANFGGGVMVDDPAIGRLLGPNLTTGKGGVVEGYTPADWDRIVRHGVRKNGHPGAMPSEDFQKMSDRELSDIIAYIRTQPAVDNEVPPVTLGPLGTLLIAFGKLPLSVDIIHDHQSAHRKHPPATAPTEEFGAHLANICTGCHRADFTGGPVVQGPPDWPPARNLTPHEQGLKGWTYDDFVAALREGRRPDGTGIRDPMIRFLPYAQRMTDVELRALWAYISTREPLPTGQ